MGLNFTGLDLPADLQDLIYDVTNWEWTWGHTGQTLLDGIGLIPLIGAIKNADEAADILKAFAKNSDEAADVLKHADEVADTVSDVAKNLKPQNLMDELLNSGVKYNVDDVIAVTKTVDGKLVWLEKGNGSAGLAHIMRHADDFAKKGINTEQLSDFIIKAISEGKIVDVQNTRPIYEVFLMDKFTE